MSPVRRRVLILAVPVLLAATGGCSEAAGPTQEEYAAVADDTCKGAGERLATIYMEHAVEALKVSETGESGIYTDRPETWVRSKVVPEYRAMAGNLKGIQPPDGDVTYLTDLYADLDAVIETLHRRPSDGREVIEGDAQLRDRFESYGITQCPPVQDEAPDHEDPEKVAEAAREADEPAE